MGWWSVAARLAISGGGQIGQCIGKIGGAQPAVSCQDRSSTCTRRCMAGDWKGGSVLKEGWAEIWVDRCLWVLGV